jgi:ketosteroid isomerase-like protein
VTAHDLNIAAVRRGFEAMRSGDFERQLEDCDTEIEFAAFVSQVEGHNYHGHDGMWKFFSDIREAWEPWEPMPQVFEGDGDTVLVTGMTNVRGKGSGMEMSMDWAQVFRRREDKVVWTRIYTDRAEARAEFDRQTG